MSKISNSQLKAILMGGSRPYIHPKLDMPICYDTASYIDHYGCEHNSICIPNCHVNNIAHVKSELFKYFKAMTLGSDVILTFDEFNCKWILEYGAKKEDGKSLDATDPDYIKIEVRLCYYYHRENVFAEVQHKLGEIGIHHTICDDIRTLVVSRRFLKEFKIATTEKNN